MKPICVPCQRFYHCFKNGYYFLEGMPIIDGMAGRPQPGTAEPEKWKPYKMWVGDMWRCEGCGHQIISGVASHRLAEHYEPDFEALVKQYGADQLQVNDC